MADPQARFILSAEDRTRAAILAAQGNLQRLERTAGTVRNALGLLAGAFAIRGVARFTSDTLQMAQSIGDVAEKAGITTTQLQTLRFAADQNGSSAAALDKAIIKLNVNIGQTATFLQGLTTTEGEATQALDALGISVLDAGGNTRTLAQIFPELIDALAAIENPIERAGLASRVFGARIGPELAVLINQGSDALAGYQQRLEETGALLGDDLVQSGRRAADQFGALALIVKTNFQAGVLQGFLGDFESLEELVTDPEFRDGVRQLGETVGSLMRTVVEQGPAVAQHLQEIRAVLIAIAGIRFGAELGSLFGVRGKAIGAGIGLTAALFADMALQARDADKAAERTTESLQRQARQQLDAAVAATRAQAQMALGTRARMVDEEAAAERFGELKDQETEHLRGAIAAQKALYDQATKDLEAARTAQEDIEKEFADARAQLIAGPQGEDVSFLDAAGLGFQAREALRGGDAERAIELARQAKDAILALREQGDGGLALVGLFDQVAATANAAAAQQTAALEQTRAQAATAIQELADQAGALQRIKVGFLGDQAITDAQALRAAIEAELAKNPVTIPVVLDQIPGGAFADQIIKDAAKAPARARGGYIPGRSPHPRADNILARLTAGEYVLPVDAVQRIRRERGDWVLEALRQGTVPAFALGGLVGGPRPVDLSGMAAAVAARPAPAAAAVVNVTLPGGETFALGADLDVAQALAAAVRREALKGGRR